MRIPVVFSTDHNFIMPTSVAISSMLRHSSDCEIIIYIFQANNVTDEDRILLQNLCSNFKTKIEFIDMGEYFKESLQIRGISTPTYYRLLIPWILPQHDKIIYCDGDIVFKQSISYLYSVDIENKFVGGVWTGYGDEKGAGYIKKLGLDPKKYINAGILIINSHQQRKMNLKDKYLSQSTKKYLFQDQDIINIICKGEIAYLSPWFNTTPFCLEMPDNIPSDEDNISKQISSPVIIHYAGVKPWKEFTFWWCDWWNEYQLSPFWDSSLEFIIEKNTLSKEFKVRDFLTYLIRRKLPILGKLLDGLRQLLP